MDFSTGFSTVAPAATAESNSALTLAGCATTSDIVNPRKPVVGASDCVRAHLRAQPEGVGVEACGRVGIGHLERDRVDGGEGDGVTRIHSARR